MEMVEENPEDSEKIIINEESKEKNDENNKNNKVKNKKNNKNMVSLLDKICL